MTAQRILLSEGSSLSAREVITALGRAGHVIDVCDPDPYCLGRFSRYVRHWHSCPPAAADPWGYLRFIVRVVATGAYDVLFPTHEQAFLFARAQDKLSGFVGLALTDFSAFCRVQNKASFIRVLRELAIPHPPTRIVTTEEQLRSAKHFPCYVKAEYGTASATVWRCNSPEDVAAAIQALKAEGWLNGAGQVLLQQAVEGKVEHVQAVFDRGRLVVWHGYDQRVAGPGGGDAAKTSVLRPAVRDHVARLGERLTWHGAISLDYLVGKDGQRLWFLDGNARLVEPMNALLAGTDLADILVRISLGEPVAPCAPGREGVRTHLTLMALLAAAAQTGRRRDVLRRLAEVVSGRGDFENSTEELTPVGEDPWSAGPLLVVLARLLARPRSAQAIAARAIHTYALSAEATREITDGIDLSALSARGDQCTEMAVAAGPVQGLPDAGGLSP